MFNQYARYYDLFNRDKSYRKEIEFVCRWAGKPKWIFDIGAGTGNYWKFCPKGTRFFGVEKSPYMMAGNPCIIQADIMKYKPRDFFKNFDCAIALFDVLNYIPKHDWWENIPIDSGGYWIFDIWDKKKVDKKGFEKTVKKAGKVTRTITPLDYDGKKVDLEIAIDDDGVKFKEIHKMYVWSDDDIARFCGKDFTIVDTKGTETWQKWYKLKRE